MLKNNPSHITPVSVHTSYHTTFAQLAATLLHQDSSSGERLAAANSLIDLYAELTGIHTQSAQESDTTCTLLDEGMALSPRDAGRCLLDIERTGRFLLGIEAAIREAQRRFPGTSIEILYAGCGPYATLALPLCTRFSPDEVRFTLLDIHERSLTAARIATEQLGLRDFIRGYIQCDVTHYRVPDDARPHIVIAEILQRSLEKEPQVAVTAGLAPQLAENGIFIPQRIAVDLCLVNMAQEFRLDGYDGRAAVYERDRIMLGNIMEVTAGTIAALMECATTHGSGMQALPALRVRLPQSLPPGIHAPALLTKLQVFDSFVLNDYDSGLTLPKILHELPMPRGGEIIELQYVLGRNPGFIYRYVEE